MTVAELIILMTVAELIILIMTVAELIIDSHHDCSRVNY
jgi:hypothetical protein